MELLGEIGSIALTTLLSIVVLFLMVRLMGVKQVSQMTMFDYVTGITIGSIAAELATELEEPARPLTALIIYGLVAMGISILTNKSLKLRTLLTGKPKILLENGAISRKNLKRARMDLDEFLTLSRIAGYFDLSQVQTALLEHNGSISFLPKEQNRTATPSDLHLDPPQQKLPIAFVMDGIILTENLRIEGKEESWVLRALARQGYRDEKGVLLALWLGGEQLAVFPEQEKSEKKEAR